MVPAPGTGSADDDPAATTDGSGDGRPRPFQRHTARVIDRFGDLWAFALVPLFVPLLEFEKVQRALDSPSRGFAINFEFLVPTPLVTLWRVADPPAPPAASTQTPREEPYGSPAFGDAPGEPSPTDGPTAPAESAGSSGTDVTVETPVETVEVPLEAIGLETMAWIGLALAAYAVISGLLMAGYVGGIDRRLRGEPIAITSCVVTYAPRFVLYNLVALGAFLLVVPVFALVPGLFLLAIPVIVILGYVFYPVPFLFVVDDAPFLEAFRQAVRLTTAGGPVLSFAFWHIAAGVVASVALSILVSTGGAGFLLALLVSAPFGLLLTAATVSFFRAHLEGDGLETAGGPSSGDTETPVADEYG